MNYQSGISKSYFIILILLFFVLPATAQNVKRVVIVKTDGLSGDLVDRFVKERDSSNGKSLLPWFEEIFYKNGTRLENFYVRGISLSGPSWTLLDTGQCLQIKGNIEYDRYTLHSYDYLNFFPFYAGYGLDKFADMPAAEVMNKLQIPILSEAFDYEKRYTSPQILGKGVNWKPIANGFMKFYPRNPDDFIDEWTVGLDYRNLVLDQNERDIIFKLNNRPEVEYFDYFTGIIDHVSHSNNDVKTQLAALQEVDRVIGRIWTGIQSSPGADKTALIIISDHGFNSDEKVYSQGFNIVKLLTSADGGGHHVVTKQHLMRDYSIKGIYPPFKSIITNESKESFYLKNQAEKYPTALIDFDGNERASFHLRNADLNALQILFQQLQKGLLTGNLKNVAAAAFFEIIEKHRAEWTKISSELGEEMDALHRRIESQQKIIAAQPKKYAPEESAAGRYFEDRRVRAQNDIAIGEERDYREYIRILNNLLSLKKENFDAKKLKIEDYIAKGAMGEKNSVYQLQNYIVGLSPNGLMLGENGRLDFENSFRRVNYFELLKNQSVRNNVQENISKYPVDFTAVRIPLETIAAEFSADLKSDESPIWLCGGNGKQALLLTRRDVAGNQSYRYLPVTDLRQNADGKFTFQINDWRDGFPLKIYEDKNFDVSGSKKDWLDKWHTEDEWLNATHKTFYSNAVIGLNEQMIQHRFASFPAENLSTDEQLVERFHNRQRSLVEADILVMANNHWNFDVRGFNPGGNHGSFFRVSTISTLMLAGGAKTNIPRGFTVKQPYDSLSFVPTVLYMTGKIDAEGNPAAELYKKGFRKFPGKIIKEVFDRGK